MDLNAIKTELHAAAATAAFDVATRLYREADERAVFAAALAEAGVDYATAIRWLVDDALRRAPVPQE